MLQVLVEFPNCAWIYSVLSFMAVSFENKTLDVKTENSLIRLHQVLGNHYQTTDRDRYH